MSNHISEDIDFLEQVRKPSRYTGNEFNVIRKNWDSVDLRLVLAFPDLYELGMSHQGLQILYHIVNSRPELLAERVYVPDTDMEAQLKAHGRPLFSLESRHGVKDFDILGITLPYELCYTNILTLLDLSGLAFRAADRHENDPLVIGGGPCAFHPEPVADFFDAILLGDGEEAVLDIAHCVLQARKTDLTKKELLLSLSNIDGVYVPSLFQPRYDDDGNFFGMDCLRPDHTSVRRRVLADLDLFPDFNPPLTPLNRIVHDRLGIEIARGCTRGCRFCQAGIIYRPVRERSPDWIFERARSGIEQSGFDELAMLSLSTGDYACLPTLLVRLMDYFSSRQVSVSMPSMRVGTLTPEIMNQVKRVRKTGFTVAPEAGTDRLRRVINKGISEEDLLATCQSAFELGWKLIKLYFMFGLPTETWEDLEAIVDLAHKAHQSGQGKGAKVTVSIGTFVPKPHTPFQWHQQLSVDAGFERIDFLKKKLRHKGFRLKWADPRSGYIEGVMSRGDRRLGAVIEEAWYQGARLDAWNEYFRLERWQQAAEKCGVDLDRYLEQRDFDQPLPWNHLDPGLDSDFFRQEYDKAMAMEYTPDCRVHGCQECGLCDFKTIQPVVYSGEECGGWQDQPEIPHKVLDSSADKPVVHYYYRLDYQRIGRSRLLGHLELLQVFFRVFRRASLELHFSQGFNPSPKVSFSPALPLGTESLAEFLLVDLKKPIANIKEFQEDLNERLPDGLKLNHVESMPSRHLPERIETGYEVTLPQSVQGDVLDTFLAAGEFVVSVPRKKKIRHIDCRPQVTELFLVEDDIIGLSVISEVGKAGLKPMELISAILGLSREEASQVRILKKWVRELG